MHRADGGFQVGVGPGALVVRGSVDDPAAELVGEALRAGGRSPARAAACPVVGHGALAARLREVLGPAAPGGRPGPLTVHVHQHLVPPEVGVETARDGRLHLPVVVQPRRVVVGPLGGRPDDPCLHCLDRHRTDRDPGWPELATWLGHPTEQVAPLAVPADVLVAAEGVVRLVVRSVLEDRPVTPGLSHEIGSSAPHLVSRTWVRHPACPWHPARDSSGGG